MRREHPRFVVVDEIIGSSIVNFAINAAIAWLATRAQPSVSRASVAVDTVATAFVLPLMTALIGTPLVRLAVARGKLPPLGAADPLRRRPRSILGRGAALGLLSMLLVAAPCALAWSLLGPASLPAARFIWLKAAFAAALGALVTPLVGWWALHDS